MLLLFQFCLVEPPSGRHGIRIDAHGVSLKRRYRQPLLFSLIHAQIDGIQHEEFTVVTTPRRLIRRLILNEIRRFFVDRYAGDASILILQLLQDGVRGIASAEVFDVCFRFGHQRGISVIASARWQA